MQARQLLFCFAQEARVGNGDTFRVGIEGLQPHINADLGASWRMLYLPICLHRKLDIVAISPLQETDPLDLAGGERFDRPCADQPQCANAVPIGEGEALPIWLRFQPEVLYSTERLSC